MSTTLRTMVAAGLLTLAQPGAARAVEISIACSALGLEREICASGAERWAEATGNSVRIVSTPNSATERLALYQQLLAAGAEDVDVFQIDVVWPGLLGDHFVDLGPATGEAAAAHFPAMIAANTVGDRLVALPWFADAGLLYYRSDLLEAAGRPVPESWAELRETAALVQERQRQAGDDGFWGYVWQGRAYEGLTVNALEWIASHGGGTIVDEAGEITIDNEAAAKALETAAGWVGTISPRGVLAYAEEESRGVFQGGHALFMRNWPYAYPLAQGEDSAIAGKVGVAPLPAGGPDGRHAAGLGGQSLAVSRYSAHPEEATDLVLFLTGAEEQKRRALAGGFNPTRPALYDDPDILAATPFIGELRTVFETAAARPAAVTGADYARVSSAFFNAVHAVLAGEREAAAALQGLKRDLARIGRRGWQR